ncbi:MAG: hypothetical protein WCH75_00110 [Candidatus Binatia bacterium]
MRRILLTLVSLTLLFGLGMMYPFDHATARTVCYEPDFVAVGAEFLRDATLCVNTKDGVRAEVKTKGLTSGNAHTFWFAYVDQPSLCTGGGPGVCTPSDFGALPPSGNAMADPLGVFGRLDSTVADKNGKETFSGAVGGLRLSSGSLVILLLYDHGPAQSDNRLLARQLLTPEDPPAGAPGLGVVASGSLFTERAIAIFNLP